MEDTVYTVGVAQLLTGWADPEGDPLTAIGVTADHGTTVAYNAADNTWSLTPALNYSGPVTIHYQMSDGANTALASLGFSLAPVNDAPTAIALGNTSLPENSGASSALTVGALSSTDADAGDGFAYSIVGGADQTHFQIGGANLQFKAGEILDYEAKSSYAVTVRTTDSGGLSFDQAFTVSLTDVNETPTVTSGAAVNFAENGTSVAYTIIAGDSDGAAPFNALSYSIGGTDASLFNVNASTGAVTFKAAPNYEASADANHDNVYELIVTAIDGGGLNNNKAVAITVTDVGEGFTTLKVGDAPTQILRSTPNAWIDAWSKPGVSISHKANYANAGEAWSAVKLDGLNGGVLVGGDAFAGDLGVSGQSIASSSTKQEIDGAEALRVSLQNAATQATINLSKFFSGDDGTTYREAGRVQAFKGGLIVGELTFAADNAQGVKQVVFAPAGGFDQLVLTAGAYDGGGQFVAGAYDQADGTFGVAPYSTRGVWHGSDYLVDVVLIGTVI